jgi:hypothetical protein
MPRHAPVNFYLFRSQKANFYHVTLITLISLYWMPGALKIWKYANVGMAVLNSEIVILWPAQIGQVDIYVREAGKSSR